VSPKDRRPAPGPPRGVRPHEIAAGRDETEKNGEAREERVSYRAANPGHASFRSTVALETYVCSGGTSRSGIARRDRSVAWREETLGIVGSTPPPADASRTDGKSGSSSHRSGSPRRGAAGIPPPRPRAPPGCARRAG